MNTMLTSFPRRALISASLVALTLAALSGSRTISTVSALVLFTAGVIVPVALMIVGRRGLPPTVGDVLHAANAPATAIAPNANTGVVER